MSGIKKNVEVFNADIRASAGYQYTSDSVYSAVVANQRITAATLERIGPDVETVLDLGCGDGTYTAEILRARPLLRIVGIDAAREAIEEARRRYRGIEFHTADALDLSTFPQGTFDLAIARGVLHHLSDPEKAVWNLAHCASRVLIIEPNGNNPLLKLIEKVSRYHREHEEKSFTARRIRRWCARAQARVASLSYIGFVPFYFPAPGARLIHGLQPLLEKLPLVPRLLGAQIVIELECRR
jgi:SAM-dependent methyltransferase